MISSAIYLAGAVFYGFFASGERQPWAMDHRNNIDTRPKLKNKTEDTHHTNRALDLSDEG